MVLARTPQILRPKPTILQYFFRYCLSFGILLLFGLAQVHAEGSEISLKAEVQDATLKLSFELPFASEQLYEDKVRLVLSDGRPVSAKLAFSKHRDQTQEYIIYQVPFQETMAQGLDLHFQTCNRAEWCYPPQKRRLSFFEDAVLIQTPTSLDPAEENEFSFFYKIASLGLLLAFSPCTYPMLPLLLNSLSRTPDKRVQTGLQALIYALASAATYGSLGLLSVYCGQHWAGYLQQPLFLYPVSLWLILMALYQLDYLPQKLSQYLCSWLPNTATRPRYNLTGKWYKPVLLGVLSTLFLSPCLSPALVGILSYITHSGSYWTGGLALFALGLLINSPLVALAFFGTQVIPKSGPWLLMVQQASAWLLIGLAFELLKPLLNIDLFGSYFFWSLLFIFYCKPLQAKLQKLIPSAVQVSFIVIYCLTWAYGIGREWQHSLTHINRQQKLIQPIWHQVSSMADFTKHLHSARQHKQDLLIWFSADWCINCQKLEGQLRQDPKVQAALAKLSCLELDLSREQAWHLELKQQLQVLGPPSLLLFDKSGDLKARWTGSVSLDAFLKALNT